MRVGDQREKVRRSSDATPFFAELLQQGTVLDIAFVQQAAHQAHRDEYDDLMPGEQRILVLPDAKKHREGSEVRRKESPFQNEVGKDDSGGKNVDTVEPGQ
jgi:hypothetical protein